jgi:hypothetical protein
MQINSEEDFTTHRLAGIVLSLVLCGLLFYNNLTISFALHDCAVHRLFALQ